VTIVLPADPAPPQGLRPRIVPFFLPHAGCPHHCVFCNQRAITPRAGAEAATDPQTRVIQWLGRPPADPANVQLAFYGGNFLGLPPARLRSMLDATRRLAAEGWIGGLRFSTRPDTVDSERLALLAEMPVAAVELGVQSMDDGVLAACRRRHTAAHAAEASLRLRDAGHRVGIQMMIGLPGEGPRSALATGARIAGLAPDFVRIYPCLVLAGTALADRYRQGLFRPLSLERAVVLTRRLWRLFARRGIPVIRMGLQATTALDDGPDLLAGPYHPAFGHLVHSALCLEALERALRRLPAAGRRIQVTAHPHRIAAVRGQANANLRRLNARFTPAEIRVSADPGLPLNRMTLQMSDL
jgi:histone acetyltransferase (RNA polymerase elongator complex component)